MNREEFYSQLPRLLKRLFTWGLAAATLFLVLWYFGGLNVWGYLLTPIVKISNGWGPIHFQPGDMSSAQIIYSLALDGASADLSFPVNQLNSSLVEVITLLGIWPYRDAKSLLKLAFWCLLITLAYHCFMVNIQFLETRLGPDLANRRGVFWEETISYQFIHKIAAFDKFILRFWAGFPIFAIGLSANYFFAPTGSRIELTPKSKPRPKKR